MCLINKNMEKLLIGIIFYLAGIFTMKWISNSKSKNKPTGSRIIESEQTDNNEIKNE
jgi:hypothetical protein